MTHAAALALLGAVVLLACLLARPHRHQAHRDGREGAMQDCREYWERWELLPRLECWRRYDALP